MLRLLRLLRLLRWRSGKWWGFWKV